MWNLICIYNEYFVSRIVPFTEQLLPVQLVNGIVSVPIVFEFLRNEK